MRHTRCRYSSPVVSSILYINTRSILGNVLYTSFIRTEVLFWVLSSALDCTSHRSNLIVPSTRCAACLLVSSFGDPPVNCRWWVPFFCTCIRYTSPVAFKNTWPELYDLRMGSHAYVSSWIYASARSWVTIPSLFLIAISGRSCVSVRILHILSVSHNAPRSSLGKESEFIKDWWLKKIYQSV